MKRRTFINQSAYGLVGAGIASHAVAQANTKDKELMITHYVLFWLKEGLKEKEIKDFSAFFEKLRGIPNIHSLEYGRPAPTHARDVVDNSFTYNLLVRFTKMEDINVYETHPIHLKAIEEFSQYWTKVVVHDSLLK